MSVDDLRKNFDILNVCQFPTETLQEVGTELPPLNRFIPILVPT